MISLFILASLQHTDSSSVGIGLQFEHLQWLTVLALEAATNEICIQNIGCHRKLYTKLLQGKK